MQVTIKGLIGVTAIAGLVTVIALSFQEQPVTVDAGAVERGPLVVTVEDDGITRVRERFTVSAPIQGNLVRTPLDAGDPVHKGETIIAEFAPITPSPLDERSDAEARARLKRANAAVLEAEARQKQAAADVSYFAAELSRVERLVAANIRTDEALDRARRDHIRAEEAVRAAGFAVEMARFGQELASASLRGATSLGEDKHREQPETTKPLTLALKSPVDGQVLRVFEESARTLVPGTPILDLGGIRTLEIVADFLSQDAVKVRPGMRVAVRGWGGTDDEGRPQALAGKVRLVEPSGFTKISALGVEEQRVYILIDPDGTPGAWAALGDGFRVVAHIELWSADDVLLVPTGALFRKDGAHAVFVIRNGTAHLQKIRVGRRSGLRAQVLDGLMPGDEVILYPSDLIVEGRKVKPR